MRLAVVVQRFGRGIVGGAEEHARLLSHKLKEELGWEVEVLTTTSHDYRTWDRSLPAGKSVEDGLTVRRFAPRFPRTALFSIYKRLMTPSILACAQVPVLKAIGRGLERLWFILQGPYVPDLVRYLAEHRSDYDRVIFFTYLYYPTVFGLSQVRDRAALIPTAHDEPAFHFQLVGRLLAQSSSILANTETEADLLRSVLGQTSAKITVAGLGFNVPPQQTAPKSDDTYVLYLGRISRGKGVQQLIDWLGRHPTRVKLRLAGLKESDVTWPNNGQVTYHGFVDDDVKMRLVRDATAVICPSPYESLSLLTLEAIAAGKPVLLNANCDVLRHYTERLDTAYGFHDEESFARCLTTVLATDWQDPAQVRRLDSARQWVKDRYEWQRVLSIIEQALTGSRPS